MSDKRAKRHKKMVTVHLGVILRERSDRRISEGRTRSFAEFILSVDEILRFTQNDRERMAQDDIRSG